MVALKENDWTKLENLSVYLYCDVEGLYWITNQNPNIPNDENYSQISKEIANKLVRADEKLESLTGVD